MEEREGGMSEKLEQAIAALNEAPKVNIKGKQYSTVATRVEVFRRFFGIEYSLCTKVLDSPDPHLVRVMALIYETKAEELAIASGLAEEDRRQGPVNKTSALENCETSAIGRCLANFGLHGGEYTSAGEVEGAISKQNGKQQGEMRGPLGLVELKKKVTALAGDIAACSDVPELDALVISHKEVIDQCERDLPGWYYTKENSDVTGLQDRISDRLVDLNPLTAG